LISAINPRDMMVDLSPSAHASTIPSTPLTYFVLPKEEEGQIQHFAPLLLTNYI